MTPLFSKQNQHRVALVIGNSRYYWPYYALRNPENDAAAIAEVLRNVDFNVEVACNLSLGEVRAYFDRFLRKIDKDTVALLFYSGHGLQIGGQNYLVPIGAGDNPDDLQPVQEFLSDMSGKAGTSLIFLDACRDKLLAGGQAEGETEVGAQFRSDFREIEAKGESLIAFAAAPGQTASDGTGDLSPFAEALMLHADTNNLEIREFMTRVRNTVIDMTKPQPRGQTQVRGSSTISLRSAISRLVTAVAISRITDPLLDSTDPNAPNPTHGDTASPAEDVAVSGDRGESSSQQTPWDNSSMRGQFHFRPVSWKPVFVMMLLGALSALIVSINVGLKHLDFDRYKAINDALNSYARFIQDHTVTFLHMMMPPANYAFTTLSGIALGVAIAGGIVRFGGGWRAKDILPFALILLAVAAIGNLHQSFLAATFEQSSSCSSCANSSLAQVLQTYRAIIPFMEVWTSNTLIALAVALVTPAARKVTIVALAGVVGIAAIAVGYAVVLLMQTILSHYESSLAVGVKLLWTLHDSVGALVRNTSIASVIGYAFAIYTPNTKSKI